jgi:hypothetical protein
LGTWELEASRHLVGSLRCDVDRMPPRKSRTGEEDGEVAIAVQGIFGLLDTQVDIGRSEFIAAGRSNPCNSLRTHGAGAGIRTRTSLRTVDFKKEKKGRRINVLLIRCLFSLRALRAATVFYERYGHPGGHLGWHARRSVTTSSKLPIHREGAAERPMRASRRTRLKRAISSGAKG